jgi:DNA-binding XRE family transcriptional regulator
MVPTACSSDRGGVPEVRTSRRPSRAVRESKRFHAEARALGLRIRRLRGDAGLTIEGAAEQIDLDPTHLAKIEGGSINVTLATIVRIATGLGVPIATLFLPRPRHQR